MSADERDEAGPRRVVCLMRHAHFDRPVDLASAHLPYPLSERGRAQARGAAETVLRLADELALKLDPTIETSQLLRAWETGCLLAAELKRRTGREFRIEERSELLERSLGSCANLRFGEIEDLLARDPRLEALPPDWRRSPDFRLPVPGAESLLEAGERTARCIDRTLEVPPGAQDGRLRVVVAHGGCLRHAAVQRGILRVEEAKGLTLDYCQVVAIEGAGTGRWRHVAGDWKKRLLRAESRSD